MSTSSFRDHCRSLGGSTWLYANASNAYKDVLGHLVRSRGSARPNVVIPSYVPAKLYRASLAAGCAVRFYTVRGHCVPDLDELNAAVDDDTAAVLYVHYFGFPHRLEEVTALIQRRATHLIEDCALTLASTHAGTALGTFGDAAIFSLRKMFLFSEGGALRVGERLTGFRPRYERRVGSAFSLGHFLGQRAKYAYVRLTGGADPLSLVRVAPASGMDFSQPQVLEVKQLSTFSAQRLRFIDVPSVAAARRRNFELVARRFPRGRQLTPLHDELPPGITPSSFPFLVGGGRRDEVRRALLAAGTAAGAGWPEAPFLPEADLTSGTRTLSRTLLELPVHQHLTDRQIERSLQVLEQFALA